VHVPYFHLWSVRLHNIFPHYLINGKIFEKKNIEHKMCVLIFSVTEINLYLRRNELEMITHAYRSSCAVPIYFLGF